ncbi:GNAT family N-acetyltransferase [Paenibacillus sp. FSL H7-0331]|uniref:GNAT family N-acetyltransferase n=1 Tax=Paenibacillus sp. FSL H7-0331 TaxID=1920421 RepID=UPI00096C033E|nr:GNAT family N-acetyltransferase [Paenibacillus sp. FSL H7-0331]OMF09215.1 hypothetical protein BK127_27010 [Paenibacillus sp. FSL H7-0331]
MNIQAATLYVLNEKNKIIGINERNQTSVTAVFIGRTRESISTYFHTDLPQSIVEEIQQHTLESIHVLNLCRIIEKYKPVKDIWIGPAFTFNQDNMFISESEITLIDESNKNLLLQHFSELLGELEERMPIAAYIINDEAVSVCCSARISSQAAEAGLMTIEPYRGKGIGQKVVHKWSDEIFKQGLLPIYSTSWDNLSSQRVAQKLGLIQFGMDFSIRV